MTGDDKQNEKKIRPRKQAKKERVKKPKHLKRKLEALSEGDRQGCERILNEMRRWDEKKASKRSSRRSDRDSTGLKTSGGGIELKKSSKGESSVQQASEQSREDGAKADKALSAQHEKADGDDDSSEDDLQQAWTRKRGKRRRGRKDTSQVVQETSEKAVEVEETKEKAVEAKTDAVETGSSSGAKDTSSAIDPQKEDTRYCIGRKPVTDFVVGQKYQGRVVYVKPFGIFIDINCHSDAFCHVSRLNDDYVESPEDVFKAGDEVEARVVEVDRKRKRITVSLQSDARQKDELASIRARQARREKHTHKKISGTDEARSNHIRWSEPDKKNTMDAQQRLETAKKEAGPDVVTKLVTTRFETDMTAPELKRARKLARRSARRAERDQKSENKQHNSQI